MAVKKVNGLEIETAATKNILLFCSIQKITFILLVLMLVATLFGITGYGLLGYEVAGDKARGFWVSYDRFLRKQASTQFTVHVTNQNTASNVIAIRIKQTYLERFFIKQILPQPAMVTSDREDIIYHFVIKPGSVLNISFFTEPFSAGWTDGVVGLNQDNITFRQFIYP